MECLRDPVSVTPDKLSRGYTSFQACAPAPVVSLGRDGHLENPVALMREQVVLPVLARLLRGRSVSWRRCGRGRRRLLTGSPSRNDVCIWLPDWPGFVFGNLARGPVPTHRMRVGLSRFTGIAHEPFLNTGEDNVW